MWYSNSVRWFGVSAVFALLLLAGCSVVVVDDKPEEMTDQDYLIGTWKTAMTKVDDGHMKTVYEFGPGPENELTITTVWYAWDPFCAAWVATDEEVATGPDDYYFLEDGYVKMHLSRLRMEYWVAYEFDEDCDEMILYLDEFIGVDIAGCAKTAVNASLKSLRDTYQKKQTLRLEKQVK
jgi:hypothetical protein